MQAVVPLWTRSLDHPPTASTSQQAMRTCPPSLRWLRCLERKKVHDIAVPWEVSRRHFNNLRYKSYPLSKSEVCSHNRKALHQLIKEEMTTLLQLRACYAFKRHQEINLTEAVVAQTPNQTHRLAAPSSLTQLSMIQLSLNSLGHLAINASTNPWIRPH